MMRRVNILAALLAVVSVAACSGEDSTSTSVSAPGASDLQPTGSIQGRLTDRVTNEPIVGAVVSIGVATATTAADGTFVIRNVPATRDALNNTVNGVYLVSIDLQRVTSPVAMANSPANGYPKFSYSEVAVSYTSLDDTNGTQPGSGSGSNHDTPVTGLVADLELRVAKLASTITGQVGGCDTAPAVNQFTLVGAGFTARLFSVGSDNTGTGGVERVVATAPVTNGTFTFANVESVRNFRVEVQDANNTFRDSVAVTSKADGQTLAMWAHVCPTDNVGPMVVAISPEPGADVSPSAVGSTTAVTFTFSEPVAQNSLTSTAAGLVGNLYEQIQVIYMGNKAGNVAYTLAWNAAFTQLTVRFATAPSGKYFVRMPGLFGGVLKDQYGNAATLGLCPDDGAATAAAFGVPALASADDCTAFFSTNGAPTAAAPTGLVVTNLNTLDATGTAPTLDWLPSVGAKSYNIYSQCFQWPGYPVPVTGAMAAGAEPDTVVFLANTSDTQWSPLGSIPLIEGDNIPLACTFTVKGVNSDKIESATGPSVNISDKVAPQIFSAFVQNTGALAALPIPNPNAVTITFDEAMNEQGAETAANYTVSARASFTTPTVASVQYLSGTATLTFPAAGTTGALEWAIVPAGSATCPFVTLTGDDARGASLYDNSTNPPTPFPTCVRGPDAVTGVVTAPAAGDVCCGGGAPPCGLAGICAGADGICNTGATAPDIQVIGATQMPKCVSSGVNGVLETAPAGGNVINSVSSIQLSQSITDVAGNAISTAHDRVVVGTALGGAPVIIVTDD